MRLLVAFWLWFTHLLVTYGSLPGYRGSPPGYSYVYTGCGFTRFTYGYGWLVVHLPAPHRLNVVGYWTTWFVRLFCTHARLHTRTCIHTHFLPHHTFTFCRILRLRSAFTTFTTHLPFCFATRFYGWLRAYTRLHVPCHPRLPHRRTTHFPHDYGCNIPLDSFYALLHTTPRLPHYIPLHRFFTFCSSFCYVRLPVTLVYTRFWVRATAVTPALPFCTVLVLRFTYTFCSCWFALVHCSALRIPRLFTRVYAPFRCIYTCLHGYYVHCARSAVPCSRFG